MLLSPGCAAQLRLETPATETYALAAAEADTARQRAESLAASVEQIVAKLASEG